MSWNRTIEHSSATGPRFGRSVGAAIGLASATVFVLLAAGFIWFVWRLPTTEVNLTQTADGIVVLTGGASRIEDAVELLASGRGKRLLISGVHPGTTTAEIAHTMPEYAKLLSCCTDLDHSARNTLGNAVETRRWVRRRGFRSLIVVTSRYHMPRTMLVLTWQMPELNLIPFPVIPHHGQVDPDWALTSARLLVSEYLKFIAVWIRTKIDHAPDGIAMDRVG